MPVALGRPGKPFCGLGNRMKTIGIIGYGFVGKAVHAGFPNNPVLIRDPLFPETAAISDLVAQCDVIFVCVPTPMRGDGGPVDLNIIALVLHELEASCKYQDRHPIIVIKSTVPASALIAFGELNLRLTMSPEYLREKDAVQAFLHAELLVVGAKDYDDGMRVVDLFETESVCDHCPYFIVDLPSAGIIKYMENTFLAMKVTFMNQWKAVHEATGSRVPWEKVVAAFHADSRCGRSHGQVPGPDGLHGYGGKCLPKDVAGAIHMARSLSQPLTLLEEVQAINDQIREKRDWLTIKGAVS